MNRRPKPGGPPTRYRCPRCRHEVILYVRATVACSRCGRRMRPAPREAADAPARAA